MSIRLFLSHASEDKPLIRSLYARLTAVGLEPWLDEIDLVAGQNWKEVITSQIKASEFFLACLTPNSVKTGFLRDEFEYALDNYSQQRSGSIFLIPVKLLPCEIPDVYNEIAQMNLRDFHWLEYWVEGGFEKLLQIIQQQTQFVVFSDWIRSKGYRILVLEGPFGTKAMRVELPGFLVRHSQNSCGTLWGFGDQKSEAILDMIGQIEGKYLTCFSRSDFERMDVNVPRRLLLGDIKSYNDLIVSAR
jgi:hypothetical protein